MNDSNYFFPDQNFFIPNEDIFTAFLNSTENKKPFEPIQESIDEIFKIDSNLNIFANFLNNDNDLKREIQINNINNPQKLLNTKSAFTKMDTKETIKTIHQSELSSCNNILGLNNINNNLTSPTNSINNSSNTNSVTSSVYCPNSLKINFSETNKNSQNFNQSINCQVNQNINFGNNHSFSFSNNVNNNSLKNTNFNNFNKTLNNQNYDKSNLNINNIQNKIDSDKILNLKNSFTNKKHINVSNSFNEKELEECLTNKKPRIEIGNFRRELENSIPDSNVTNFSNSNPKYIDLDNNKINKTIFKTIKSNKKHFSKMSIKTSNFEKEITTNVDMKKMMKLMKNRLSARKCRQKKKSYVKNLEREIAEIREELNKYKSIQTNEMKLEYYIDKLNEKEREIKTNIQKKKNDEHSIIEFSQVQQNLLVELFRRILKNIVPIEFKLFTNKCIKIHELEKDDSLDMMINKIKENHEILKEIYDFNNTSGNQLNSILKNNNTIPFKMLSFFHYLKKFSKKFMKNVLGKAC